MMGARFLTVEKSVINTETGKERTNPVFLDLYFRYQCELMDCINTFIHPQLRCPRRSRTHDTVLRMDTPSTQFLVSTYHSPLRGPRFLEEMANSKARQRKSKISQKNLVCQVVGKQSKNVEDMSKDAGINRKEFPLAKPGIKMSK